MTRQPAVERPRLLLTGGLRRLSSGTILASRIVPKSMAASRRQLPQPISALYTHPTGLAADSPQPKRIPHAGI